MRAAIKAVAGDANSPRMVERAQRRMVEAGLTSRDFARRHAQLSRELLDGAVPTVTAGAAIGGELPGGFGLPG
jgi:hypothetical protein